MKCTKARDLHTKAWDS